MERSEHCKILRLGIRPGGAELYCLLKNTRGGVMSTQRREDEQDAKTSRKSLRLAQLLRLTVPFSLSRQVFFPFEQRIALWSYSE